MTKNPDCPCCGELENLFKRACEDAAHDHTVVEQMARAVGVPNDKIASRDGGYSANGIIDLVELIVSRLKEANSDLVEKAWKYDQLNK